MESEEHTEYSDVYEESALKLIKSFNANAVVRNT